MGCQSAQSTTTDGSGNYSFSGANKLTFSGNGPTTLTLTASKTGYTSNTVVLNNAGTCQTCTSTFTNENIALDPSGPTKLAFTSAPTPGAVGQCLDPITVQTQNASGTATNVTATTTVDLTTDNGSTGAGAFYSDNGCSSSTTSRTITTGNNSTSFYYKATGRGTGTHVLTAADHASVLTSATQSETINKAAQATLAITDPSDATFGHADYAVVTSGGSGSGALSVSVTSGAACSIVSGKVHVLTGTGTCGITAHKDGDADYLATDSAEFAVAIHKGPTTTSLAASPASGSVFGGSVTLPPRSQARS